MINLFKKSPGSSEKLPCRWPRAIARSLDLVWQLAIVLPLFYLFTTKLIPVAASSTGWLIVISFVSLPIALLLDAIVARVFGNTPAKAIAGISVRTFDRDKLGLIKHIKRNYAVWTDGMAMGILPFTYFSGKRQFRKISSGRSSTYDRRLGFRVSSRHNSGLRLSGLVVALLTIAPSLAAFVYSNVQRQPSNTLAQVTTAVDDKAVVTTSFNSTLAQPAINAINDNTDTDSVAVSAVEVEQSVQSETSKGLEQDATENVLWTNPLSGLSTEISGQFEILQTANGNASLASFNHRSSNTIVEFEQLEASGSVDQNQIPALVSVALDDISVNGTWIDFEFAGLQIFESSGVANENGDPVSIQATLQAAGSSPRILMMVMRGRNYTNQSADFDRLRAAVWSSI